MLRVITYIFALVFCVFSTYAAAQTNKLPPNFPWEVNSERFLDHEGLESHICGGDEIGNIVCFEFFWRKGKFELFAFVALLNDDDQSFHRDMVPEFIIDGQTHGNQNKMLEIDRWLGYEDYPYQNNGRSILWREAIGSPRRVASAEKGVYYRLRRARTLALRSYYTDGSVLVTTLPVENLAEGLNFIFEEAAALENVFGNYDEDE